MKLKKAYVEPVAVIVGFTEDVILASELTVDDVWGGVSIFGPRTIF